MLMRFLCCIVLVMLSAALPIYSQELKSEVAPSDLSENNPIYQELLQHVRDHMKKLPNSAGLHFTEGFVHQSFSRYEKAIESFKQGLTFDANNPSICLLIANLYKRLYEYEEAVLWYEKVIKLDPAVPQANKNLGLCLVQLNRNDDALNAFKRELEHYPNDPSSHYYLAQQYFQAENYDLAKKHAEICNKLDGRLAEPLHLIAKIHQMQGEMEAAKALLQTFNEVRKIEYELVDSANKTEQKDEQEKAVIINTYMMIAQNLIRDQHDDQAEKQLLLAIKVSPQSQEPRMLLYNLYQETKQTNKAKTQLTTLIRLDPKNVEYHKMMVKLFSQEKQISEAIRAAEQAHRDVPDSPEIKRMLAQLYLNSNQNHSQALDLMLGVITNQSDAQDYDVLSWAYYTNGMLNECLEALNRARKLEPSNPTYEQRYQKLKERIESFRKQ